ncbi:MAG: hypothetical protein KGH49_02530 [Candidatus Micrarchaeota archaeon]|nr:hypothetical protein [Candidatus Micrarchaeota archaeon]
MDKAGIGMIVALIGGILSTIISALFILSSSGFPQALGAGGAAIGIIIAITVGIYFRSSDPAKERWVMVCGVFCVLETFMVSFYTGLLGIVGVAYALKQYRTAKKKEAQHASS